MKKFGIWYWLNDPKTEDPSTIIEADELVVVGNVYIFRVNRPAKTGTYDVVYSAPTSAIHHIQIIK